MKTTLLLALCALLTACSSTAPTTGGVRPYPLKTCIVTDNALGSMGDVITITHEGREVKFCCKPCVAKFQKNPAKYLAKLP